MRVLSAADRKLQTAVVTWLVDSYLAYETPAMALEDALEMVEEWGRDLNETEIGGRR
jgi:hypothetical protein